MARRLMSVLVSFRSFIELMTTVPFLLSNFMQNGQYLYGIVCYEKGGGKEGKESNANASRIC